MVTATRWKRRRAQKGGAIPCSRSCGTTASLKRWHTSHVASEEKRTPGNGRRWSCRHEGFVRRLRVSRGRTKNTPAFRRERRTETDRSVVSRSAVSAASRTQVKFEPNTTSEHCALYLSSSNFRLNTGCAETIQRKIYVFRASALHP